MANLNASNETSVAWQVDDINVNASLTRPNGAGPFPAVIMVAGSGPTDRNWNTPLLPGTNGSAALMAKALTEAGFVTLRYDKRASGPQLKENVARLPGKISLKGHLEELTGGVRLLAARKDVIPSRIYVLSNSEGSLHALYYQTQAPDLPFAGLVLTAAFARPAGTLAHDQIAAQLAAAPGGDKLLGAYDAAMADFVSGRELKIDESLPEQLRNMILAITNPLNQPFSRELWTTDPVGLLAMVSAPILIVIGKKDIQVDWQVDGALFEAVAKDHKNINIEDPENASHVLKYEPKDRSQITAAYAMETYSAEGASLDNETVEIIKSWLVNQSRRP